MKNTKKNIIPVIAVLVLIVIIILFMLLGRLIEKYTPSKEHQELSEYYGLASDDSVALIFNNEVLSVQGRLIDGNVYLDFETVHDKINSRFFWDANENTGVLLHLVEPPGPVKGLLHCGAGGGGFGQGICGVPDDAALLVDVGDVNSGVFIFFSAICAAFCWDSFLE